MAKIISLKNIAENKYLYEIEMNKEESNQLKGDIKDLVVFSEKENESTTKITKRGKEGRTKYFLIPKELRKRTDLLEKKIICQRLDLRNKTFFIYAVDKEQIYN